MTDQHIAVSPDQYGTGDASFRAAGGEAGIRRLVDCFYDYMASLPVAAHIRDMHPADMAGSRDKLFRFLCGWLGGPKLFQEKYGPIRLPVAHQHFEIGHAEKEAWLTCMKKALADQPFQESFKVYMLEKLQFPAEKIRNKD